MHEDAKHLCPWAHSDMDLILESNLGRQILRNAQHIVLIVVFAAVFA